MILVDIKKVFFYSEGFNELDIEWVYINLLSFIYDKYLVLRSWSYFLRLE